MPVVSEVDRTVALSLRRAGLARNGSTLVVGVSGGADSSTLLYSLNHLRQSCGISLHVAHLNHDFRGEEANEDARFVEAMAQSLGLPVTVEKRDPIAYQQERDISSFEQGAREMRYEFMSTVAQRIGASVVAVGHTSDDLAETVLLHILRGAGLPGVSGMTEIAPWPWPTGLESPVLFRPLLEVTKSETVEYCKELDREYRQDSGNYLFRFTRNRVRQDLMPLLAAEYNPRVRDALVRLAQTSSIELDYLETELERIWPSIHISQTQGNGERARGTRVTMSREALQDLHPALRQMALRRAYIALNGDPRRLRENHLTAMSDLIASQKPNGSLNLPRGTVCLMTAHELSLGSDATQDLCPFPYLESPCELKSLTQPGSREIQYAGEWNVTLEAIPSGTLANLKPPDALTAYLDPKALGGTFVLRTRLQGDRFQPLGMTGEKKLKDFFIDAKVPSNWRDRVPLVVSNKGIAWLVGYRIAEWAKVLDGQGPDDSILRVSFKLPN